jgi:O-antigen ligase
MWLVAFSALVAIPWLVPFAVGPAPGFVALTISWLAFGALVHGLGGRGLWIEPYRLAIALTLGWILAGVVSCCIAYFQYFGISEGLQPWVSYSKLGEAYANLRQRNQFATLTNIAFAALVLTSTALPDRWRRGLWFVAAFLATGNAMSASRTGLLELGGIAVLTLWWNRRMTGKQTNIVNVMVGVAVVAYCIAAAFYPMLVHVDTKAGSVFLRFHEEGGTCSSRLTLWSNVIHLILQKPWFGWGWGELDYAHFVTLYPGERFCEILDNAHNLPLHLAVELGLPVALFVCGVCGWLVWRNKPWAETDSMRQMAWGVLAVIGLHSMLEYPLWYGPFQIAVLLCAWILWTVAPRKLRAPRNGTISLIAGRLAALTLIGLCAIVAWEYWRVSQLYLQPAARSAMYREDTLKKVRNTWFFGDQIKFAELTTTELTADNDEWIHTLALEMLHFSPEPRVIEKVIESAVMHGQDAEALYYLQRYKAAFPAQHARWSQALKSGE